MPWYKRCGCDCHNLTTLDEPCEDRQHITCCLDCPDGAPSAYAVLFECCMDCLPSLLAPPFMLLWKDCLFDCFWSSRVCEGEDAGLFRPQCTADFADLCGIFNDLGTLDFPHTFDGCGDIPIHHPSGGSDIGAFYDLYGLSTSQARQITSYLNDYTFVAWQLEVVGDGMAELRAYCRNWFGADPPCIEGEVVATYLCEDFVCLGRNTFHRVTEDGYPVIVADPESRCIALPNHVCVVPAVSQWRTPCETAADACACYDPGQDSAYLDVDLGTCGGLQEDVEITRNATLPTGVTEPSPAPCGWFWGDLGTICTGVQFGVLTYCDGTNYHVDLWCNRGSGWYELDTAIAMLTDTCPGATYTWTWSGDWGDCCCVDGTTVPCCADPVNNTLYLDLVADCAALNGGSATLTYQGTSSSLPGNVGTSRHYWTGSFDGGACGTVYVLWHLPATSGCDSVLQLGLSSDFSNDCGFRIDDQITCPFTSKTYGSRAWDDGVCPCCTGNVTATVAV